MSTNRIRVTPLLVACIPLGAWLAPERAFGQEEESTPATEESTTEAPSTDREDSVTEAAPETEPAVEGETEAESGSEAAVEGESAPAIEGETVTEPGAEPAVEGETATEPDAEPAVEDEAASATESAVEGQAAPETDEAETSATVTEDEAVIEQKAPERRDRFPITGGVEFGIGFAQILSKLGATADLTFEVGYLLPFFEQRIEALVDIGYVRPLRKAEASDPRLELSEEYAYKIREEELTLTFGGLYRWFPPGTQLNFYGHLGWRIRFQRATVQGKVDTAGFGKNEEQATKALGLVFGGGAEWMLGPGAIAAELSFAASDLDHYVTGESTAGGLGLQVGYHLLF